MRFLWLAGLCAIMASCAQQAQDAAAAPPNAAHGLEVVSRTVDSSEGRALFVDKGCIICHAVNGVGGKAATPLDAAIGSSVIDPLEFAARMWGGAPAMIELQAVELGYSIYLTADEIADLAGFSSDREEQKLLVIDAVPQTLRDSFLDEQFWELEDWDEFLRRGREGEIPGVAAPPSDDEAPPPAAAQPR
jgi:cytochrome c